MSLLSKYAGFHDSYVSSGHANHYRSSVVAGSIVKVDRFQFARCSHMYKITEHQYVIRFIPSTTVEEVRTGNQNRAYSAMKKALTIGPQIIYKF